MSVIYGNPIIAGGGGLELVANVVDGATVTATLGSKTVTGVSVGGQVRLKIPQEGKWTVSATNGTMVSAPQEVSVPATVDLALPSHVLNDTSWAVIKQMSAAGEGANFWAVGDCKEITMNGKVSSGLTLSNYTAFVYIIGFDHNSEREGTGIAFMGFKTKQTDGKFVCLTDDNYSNYASAGFIIYPQTGDYSTTKWSECYMRNVVMPLIKAAFPTDLQAVVKTSSIYSEQISGNNITMAAFNEEVYLLAEYEVFGTRTYATTSEPNFLKQYAYFAAGNSKVAYRHNYPNNKAQWWERSMCAGDSLRHCKVSDNGSADYRSYGYYSYGVAPCFKV